MEIVGRNTPLPPGLIGVTTIEDSVTHGHVILKPPAGLAGPPHSASRDKRLAVCAGRTTETVESMLLCMKKHADNVPLQAMIQETAATGPKKLPYRGYTVLNSEAQAMGIKVGE